MKNFVFAFALCLFAVSLVGCGSKADRLVKKQIKLMNKMADELEAGKSRKDLKDLEDQMTEIGKEMNDLDLSKEEKDRLKEKYEDKLTEAMKRLMQAQFKGMADRFGKGGSKGGPGMPGLPSFGK